VLETKCSISLKTRLGLHIVPQASIRFPSPADDFNYMPTRSPVIQKLHNFYAFQLYLVNIFSLRRRAAIFGLRLSEGRHPRIHLPATISLGDSLNPTSRSPN
jgi:hypothetical protein